MRKLLTIVLLSSCIPCFAAGFKSIEQADNKLAEVMKLMDSLEFEKGYNALKPYWPLPAEEIDALIYKTRQQLPLIRDRFGSPLGSEKACVQSIGDSWKRISYLQKYEKHTLVWQAEFYKPKDVWVLNGFAFHDRWQTLFEQNCANK